MSFQVITEINWSFRWKLSLSVITNVFLPKINRNKRAENIQKKISFTHAELNDEHQQCGKSTALINKTIDEFHLPASDFASWICTGWHTVTDNQGCDRTGATDNVGTDTCSFDVTSENVWCE